MEKFENKEFVGEFCYPWGNGSFSHWGSTKFKNFNHTPEFVDKAISQMYNFNNLTTPSEYKEIRKKKLIDIVESKLKDGSTLIRCAGFEDVIKDIVIMYAQIGWKVQIKGTEDNRFLSFSDG